jgi:surface antigen
MSFAMLGACAQQDNGGIGAKTAGDGAPAIAAGANVGDLPDAAADTVLGDRDERTAQRTTQNTLESTPIGQSGIWKRPDNGNSGAVTPTRTQVNAQGGKCREYRQINTVSGRTEQGYGSTRRDADDNRRIAG